jgi:branched-chain amino acid transport system substrate-binding protein
MSNVKRGWGLRLASALGVLVLATAACSSSSKSSSTSQTTGSTGAQPAGSGSTQAKGAPFKIGYIEDAVSLGAGSNNPYTIPAFKAWVSWTNAHGGINGHPVQLFVKRESNNPGIALTDVQQLVGDGIITLVEDDVTDTEAWIPYIEKTGIPVIEGANPSVAASGNPNFFATITSVLLSPQMDVRAAAKAGGSKMGVFYCAEIPECGQLVPALAAVGKQVGVTVPFSSSILGSAPNYIAQCLAAKGHGADSLFVADASQIILRLAASCAQQGYTPPQIANTTNIQQNFAGAPGMDGLVAYDAVAPFFDTGFAPVATMTAAFNQYDPGLTKDPQYGDLSTEQWTDGLFITEAAKAGGVGTTNPLSATAMMNGIYTLHSTNLGGMTPTLTFERGQAHANRCWFWVTIKNGKYTLPDGLTSNCLSQ